MKKINIFIGVIVAILIGVAGFCGIKYMSIKDDSSEIVNTQEKKKDNTTITTTTTITTLSSTTTTKKTTKSTTTTKKSTTKGSTTVKKTTVKTTTTVAIDDNDPIAKKVKGMKIVAVGDSVMLGAVLSKTLQKKWPNGYVDAKQSRSMGKGIDVLKDLKSKNKLNEPIIVHLGTNGGCTEANLKKIMDLADNREVFMMTTTYSKLLKINTTIKNVCSGYSNCHVIDWYKYVNDWRSEHADDLKNGWKDITYKDGIHLRTEKGTNSKTKEKQPLNGRQLYAECVYEALYDYYK